MQVGGAVWVSAVQLRLAYFPVSPLNQKDSDGLPAPHLLHKES